MSMFANPEEHAANPPASWVVVKVRDHDWRLRTAAGVELDGYPTRKAAEEGKTSGPWVRMYERESRWYAGEPVSGWKPYADVVAEQEQAAARRATRDARAAVVELAGRLADWSIDHHQDPPDPEAFAAVAAGLDLVEATRAANRLRDTVAALNRHEPDQPARVPAAPLGEVWDAPVRVWQRPDGVTAHITAASVARTYLDTHGGPPGYEMPRHQFGTQVIARAATPGEADAFAVFWRRDSVGDWRQVTGDLPEADMVAWDGRPARYDEQRGVMDELAGWLDQVAADLAGAPTPAQEPPVHGQPPAPIVVVGQSNGPADGHTRYRLSNGWFIDREKRVSRRHYREHPYAAYAPGQGEDGGAKCLGSARTRAELLERLNRASLPQQPACDAVCTEAQSSRFVSAWADTIGGAR